MVLSPPVALLGARAVNSGNLEVEVRVNGSEVFVGRIPGTDNWTAQATVPSEGPVLLSVTWNEDFQKNRRLDLAHWQETIVIDRSLEIEIAADEYNTSQNVASNGVELNFDLDNDGSSNIDERRAGSDPLSNVSTPADIPPVEVIVPVSTFLSPNVDGRYSSGDYESQNAIFRDTDGFRLHIDNLMVNAGTASPLPSRSDGNTEMRWLAIHDNTNLYIAVLGEDVQLSTPHRDSEQVWHDDSIDIYIDADNSAGNSYDGINDFHILIPLLSDTGNSNVSGTGGSSIVVASNSAPLDTGDIQFATCGVCGSSGQHFWEVSLPLNILGIQKGTVFGIEVQINIDHDGGDRDVKWGWAHPSGSDTASRDPSKFLRAFLQ